MIRDHIASSFHIEKDDFDLSPLMQKADLAKCTSFWQGMTSLVEELNEALVAKGQNQIQSFGNWGLGGTPFKSKDYAAKGVGLVRQSTKVSGIG